MRPLFPKLKRWNDIVLINKDLMIVKQMFFAKIQIDTSVVLLVNILDISTTILTFLQSQNKFQLYITYHYLVPSVAFSVAIPSLHI